MALRNYATVPMNESEPTALTIHQPIVLLHRADSEHPLWIRVLEAITRLGYESVRVGAQGTLARAVEKILPDVILIGASPETVMNEVLGEVREIKSRDDLSRVPILVVGEAPTLDEVAAMVEAGVEDALRSLTPEILLEARLKTAVRTKYFYDTVIRTANDEALRDPLTSLWNHRRFQDLLRFEIARAGHSKRPVSLLMLDLDRFKDINDRYGHPVGDQVLIAASEAMGTTLRGEDILARYGGEEFAAILPGAGRDSAFAIASRVNEAIRKNRIRARGFTIDTSVSIGVAVFPEDAKRSEDLVASADLALYQAKRSGRDRWESVKWMPFEFTAPEPVAFVGVGGDWNAWAPERAPLASKTESRKWRGSVLMPTGKNRYKFKVRSAADYHWIPDPANAHAEPDGFGGINSIKLVGRL